MNAWVNSQMMLTFRWPAVFRSSSAVVSAFRLLLCNSDDSGCGSGCDSIDDSIGACFSRGRIIQDVCVDLGRLVLIVEVPDVAECPESNDAFLVAHRGRASGDQDQQCNEKGFHPMVRVPVMLRFV